MKAQKITKEVIESSPNGIYAIFKNESLIETIAIENIYDDEPDEKSDYPISAIMGSDEILTYEDFKEVCSRGEEKYDIEDCYIILASEVKLFDNSKGEIEQKILDILYSEIEGSNGGEVDGHYFANLKILELFNIDKFVVLEEINNI